MRRHRVRLPRTEYRGYQRYFLTFCCHARQAHFSNPTTVTLVRDQILQQADRDGLAIIAYCFMPDHLHLVVAGVRPDADLVRFVKLTKQRTGHAFKRQNRLALWQSGWYDHIVRPSDDVNAMLHYVVENPIRAGLVRSAPDYPHTGSGTMTRDTLFDIAKPAADADLKVRATGPRTAR